jgi:hypothetical protein
MQQLFFDFQKRLELIKSLKYNFINSVGLIFSPDDNSGHWSVIHELACSSVLS